MSLRLQITITLFSTQRRLVTLCACHAAESLDGILCDEHFRNVCLGPLAGLDKQRAIYEAALKALSDAARTTIVLVSRAQIAALREAERTRDELALLGVANQRIVLNGLFTTSHPGDFIAAALKHEARTL